MDERTRREWPAALAGFFFGLIVAIGIVALFVMLTSGSEETFTTTSAEADSADSGLIGQTYRSIADRLSAERKAVRPMRGDLTFRAANITWADGRGPTFARVAEMRGRIDTRAAGNGDIVVRGVAISGGDIYVEQDAQRNWNYKRVMASLLEGGDDGGPERRFIITDAAISNSRVRVNTPDRVFAIHDLSAHITRADFAGPGLPAPRVAMSRTTGNLIVKDTAYRFAAEGGTFSFPTGRVDFSVARVITGETRVANLQGTWGGDLPGYAIRATGNVENVRFQDVRFLNPRLPAVGTAAFGFAVRSISETLTEIALSNARMESEGSRITGAATIHYSPTAVSLESVDARFDPLSLALVEKLMGDTLPYRGTVTGTARGSNGIINFDVNTRLVSATVNEPLVAHLTGSARFSSTNFEIRRVEANVNNAPLAMLRNFIPGLPLKGNISGRITLNGMPNQAPINLNVRMELAAGIAIVEGRVDLRSAVPTYDLSGRLLAVNLQQLLEPNVPPVFMTARFSVVGSGKDPNTANARIHLEGRFTGWESTPHDTIHVAARLANGEILVDTAAVKLATMTATADGKWRFAAPGEGSLNYRLAFEPITPFGPYIPAIGNEDAAGNIALAGTLSGQRGNIQASGNLTGSALHAGEWSVSSIEGKYQLVLGGAFPQIIVDASAKDLNTPTAGAYTSASAKVRLQRPDFELDVKAVRDGAPGGLEIFADGRVPLTGVREIILHRARIDIGESNWALVQPAVFSWEGPNTDLAVRALEMHEADGTGVLKLDGRILPLANADFKLETIALPVGEIQRLVGRPQRLGGALTTSTTVRSSNGIPVLTSTFSLDSAIIEGVRFSQLSGDANYQNNKLIANATAVVDTAGSLELRADVPVELRFGPKFAVKMLDAGPVRVTLVSDSIALAPFAGLHAEIDDLSGSMSANVTVSGTVQDPVLNGTLAIRNARTRIVSLNQVFDSINTTVTLENRRATITQLSVKAGGYLRGSGSILFEDLNKPVLDLTAELDEFNTIGVDNQSDAAVSGTVRLAGEMSSAVLTGDITMADGYFPIPQVGARALDSELAQFEAEVEADTTRAEPPKPFFSGLRINNLRMHVGPNLWFSMEDAKAELEGDMTVNKNGDDIRLVGDLSGSRGTYVLRAGPIIRRFDIIESHVRFLGGSEINPAIDIVARRLVFESTSDRQLNVDIRVGGTMQSPTLSLASNEAQNIPQSELLSFLLFGQSSFAIGGGNVLPGDELVAETLVGGLTELMSLGLEDALLDEIGMSFDVFQIRLGGGLLNNFQPSLVVGREITRNVFLTVETGVGMLFGGTENAGTSYAIRLEWRINPQTSLRVSREPVNRGWGVLRGYSTALPVRQAQQQSQTSLEFRKRWTW